LIQSEEETNCGLLTVPKIKAKVESELGIKIDSKRIRDILRNELNLKWKRVRPQQPHLNSTKNMSLRQVFAQKYLGTLAAGKVVINLDESHFSTT
jgi:transposase